MQNDQKSIFMYSKTFLLQYQNINIKYYQVLFGFEIDLPNTVDISHKITVLNHIIPSTNQRSRNEYNVDD